MSWLGTNEESGKVFSLFKVLYKDTGLDELGDKGIQTDVSVFNLRVGEANLAVEGIKHVVHEVLAESQA